MKPCLTYWAPDQRVLTDRRVRLALAWAYPYRQVLRIRGLVPGVTAHPATSLEPPFIAEPPGTPSRTPPALRGHRAFQTSPSRARHLLAQAHALGQPIRFLSVPGDQTSRRTEHALVGALRAAGFAPHPVTAPSPSGAGARLDVRTSTWCGAYPSGGAWVPPLLATARPAIAEIRLRPLEEQAGRWNALDRTAMQRGFPLVPLWYHGVAMAHGDRVQGMLDDTTSGMPDWKSLWVSP